MTHQTDGEQAKAGAISKSAWGDRAELLSGACVSGRSLDPNGDVGRRKGLY